MTSQIWLQTFTYKITSFVLDDKFITSFIVITTITLVVLAVKFLFFIQRRARRKTRETQIHLEDPESGLQDNSLVTLNTSSSSPILSSSDTFPRVFNNRHNSFTQINHSTAYDLYDVLLRIEEMRDQRVNIDVAKSMKSIEFA